MTSTPTAQADSIIIRKCSDIEEFNACVELQKEVWKFDDIDVIPQRMFTVADKIGGQVIGAFSGEQLVGFALAIPGNRNGHLYLHSHMLAVRDEFRNAGLGRRMKLAQRGDALARGFELMEWTFDPLEIKNAYLNIERLGAIARRYNVNQYGISSSPLQGGLPTDRLVAEWWLKSKRVEAKMATGDAPSFSTSLIIDVPAEIYQWKANPEQRGRAKEIQLRNRKAFLEAFDHDLVVLGYERDTEGNGRFQLGTWDEAWSYSAK
ncbi:MAG TPA: GNAT family N-acetyltransferase [Terriglobales bacterium]|nr:GNAT family N-acetyltransferase [Terriglobales bacterium]